MTRTLNLEAKLKRRRSSVKTDDRGSYFRPRKYQLEKVTTKELEKWAGKMASSFKRRIKRVDDRHGERENAKEDA